MTMFYRAFAIFALPVLSVMPLPAEAHTPTGLIEPHMHIVPDGDVPEVALTLDACMGAADMRIIEGLIDNQVPATIFATRRWILHNPQTMTLLLKHRDLFEIEDHGAEHVPAVIGTAKPYGITPAGTKDAVITEVEGGEHAVQSATGIKPTFYRGATALYSRDSMELIAGMGLRIGGFSLNGDFGATASEAVARTRIASAHSGDVIIAHVNQPKHKAGAGVVEGVLDLKAKGFRFVRLEDVTETDD